MRFIKKIASVILLILTINLVIVDKVQAVENINIISETVVTKEAAKSWAKDKNATQTFINLADIYWDNYKEHGGVNPAIAYTQAAKETAYGNFGGVIDESYFNPCGLKTFIGGDDKDPNAHKKFDNWTQGVQAHLDHLALYAGAEGYPRANTQDPRHFSSIKGKASTIVSLGGNWAPSNTYGNELLSMYKNIESYVPPMMNVDDPVNNININSNYFVIRGWALNSSGIKEVKIYLDNNYIGNATLGGYRPDIKQAYSAYSDADKSGFEYTVSAKAITAGIRNLKIQAIGNDGRVDERVLNININKLNSKMNIDEPAVNSTIKDNIKVRGWALNSSGVKEVKIYIDNSYIGNAILGGYRPDIKQAFPQYEDGDKSGYEYSISTKNISQGSKTIKVQVVGNDGTEQESVTKMTLVKSESKMNIDEPYSNSTIKDNIKVRGWALNASGVKEVRIYVDNNYIGNARIGGDRPDIKQAFPQYENADKSGYEYNISTRSIVSGNKIIKVQAVGNDGTIQESVTKITLVKSEPKVYIDEPAVNSTIKDNIKVRGWALNASGVKEVKVYVDNNYIGNATLGGYRPDIKQAFPEYEGGDKSGYEYIINTSSLSEGLKNIKVQAVGNDGSFQETSSNIRIIKLTPKMNIDEPAVNSTIKDNIKVRGWALNASGVKEVKVYVDNSYIGNATLGGYRSDIKQAFPEYEGGDKSGYEYSISTRNITSGNKTIKVQAVGNDGTIQESVIKMTLVKSEPRVNIDEPISNSLARESIKIRGWALNSSGVKEVKIYVDNNYIGNAIIGGDRPDVKQAFPQYEDGDKSGYEYIINKSSLIEGLKNIKVQAIGNDGTQSEINIYVNFYMDSITYTSYPKSFNEYLGIQISKKPVIEDKKTLLWRYATEDEIIYYMNPLNFINDPQGKYMFLNLKYSDGLQAWQINNALKGKGVLEGKGQAFIDAGKAANVNPIYLVAHALLETGNGTSKLSKGSIVVNQIHQEFGNVNSETSYVEAKAIYNVYGIGALDIDANLWGSEKAYNEGWFTVEDAIKGGAKWIGDGYINSSVYNQNTLYKMRWDFTTATMWHQYATDVAWAYKQTVTIKNIIDAMNNPVIRLEVPSFNK